VAGYVVSIFFKGPIEEGSQTIKSIFYEYNIKEGVSIFSPKNKSS
jgi:hypothetical protein